MRTLYVIGNGFDLYHDLLTEYKDFHKYIKENHSKLGNSLKEYFNLRTKKDDFTEEYLWTNFEEDLGTFNSQAFFDGINNIDINDESFRPSMTYGLEDEITESAETLVTYIQTAFVNWLENIDIENRPVEIAFEPNSLFITFNYTLLLENYYRIPKERVFHIHGSIDNDIENIILGHNQTMKEESELDENGDSNRTLFTDSENAAKYPFHAFFKPVDDIIKKNKFLFESLSSVETVIVLGHSLNHIDRPYFEEIKKQVSINSNWIVSYRGEKEKNSHMVSLRSLGINESLFKLEELKNISPR
jgi:hypothetical protein